MGRIEQVINDFVTLDTGLLGIGQFHSGKLPEQLAIVPPDLRSNCARTGARKIEELRPVEKNSRPRLLVRCANRREYRLLKLYWLSCVSDDLVEAWVVTQFVPERIQLKVAGAGAGRAVKPNRCRR